MPFARISPVLQMSRSRAWALLMVALVIFTAIVLGLVYSVNNIRNSFGWVNHTNDVLRAIAGIERAVLEAESAERGYLLTSLDDYRTAYETASGMARARLRSAAGLVSDNDEQRERVARLGSLVDSRLDELAQVIRFGPARLDEALAVVAAARLRGLSPQIEAQLASVRGAELQLLTERQAGLSRSTEIAVILTAGLVLLALLAAGIGAYLMEHQRALAERQEAERKLQGLQAELIEISRSTIMGELATALAHELNQPLAAITNYLKGSQRILEQSRQSYPAAIGMALSKATEQAFRAGDVIQRLRALIARRDVEKTFESLETITREAVDLAFIVEKDGAIPVNFAFAQGADEVIVDKAQVQQVILNLVRNAVEAMQGSARREITIESRPADGGMLMLSVTDTGPGIDPDTAARLFEPFFTTKIHGMGIGLSLCRKIIEAQGGQLWFEPAPAGGARFSFTIPLVRHATGYAAE